MNSDYPARIRHQKSSQQSLELAENRSARSNGAIQMVLPIEKLRMVWNGKHTLFRMGVSVRTKESRKEC